MSLYFDPDGDQAREGPIFDLPPAFGAQGITMHAAAIVIGNLGLLLQGKSGTGKSVLQRRLRLEAERDGQFSALVSDDYVRLVRPTSEQAENDGQTPPLLAFSPVATRHLQEVRGLGVIALPQGQCLDQAQMHLLVDLVPGEEIERMPLREQQTEMCLDHPLPRLKVPERSVIAACDIIFACLSTWKDWSKR